MIGCTRLQVEVAQQVGEECGGDAEPAEVEAGVADAEAAESAQDDGEDDEHDDEDVHGVLLGGEYVGSAG
jgi:hypothetical protein